ncbi:hypothetical protein N8480_08080, partial [Flavobacteriaceae bacterium]|nr:hypothetical protein [Flavobacteriaceae bacterium]
YLTNKFGKIFAAVLLLLALLFPTAIQISHMVEGHEDVACNDHSTHFHKSEKTCEICVFHISLISYDIAKYPDLISAQISVKVRTNYTPLQLYFSTLTNRQLRGPPVYS